MDKQALFQVLVPVLLIAGAAGVSYVRGFGHGYSSGRLLTPQYMPVWKSLLFGFGGTLALTAGVGWYVLLALAYF